MIDFEYNSYWPSTHRWQWGPCCCHRQGWAEVPHLSSKNHIEQFWNFYLEPILFSPGQGFSTSCYSPGLLPPWKHGSSLQSSPLLRSWSGAGGISPGLDSSQCPVEIWGSRKYWPFQSRSRWPWAKKKDQIWSCNLRPKLFTFAPDMQLDTAERRLGRKISFFTAKDLANPLKYSYRIGKQINMIWFLYRNEVFQLVIYENGFVNRYVCDIFPKNLGLVHYYTLVILTAI